MTIADAAQFLRLVTALQFTLDIKLKRPVDCKARTTSLRTGSVKVITEPGVKRQVS